MEIVERIYSIVDLGLVEDRNANSKTDTDQPYRYRDNLQRRKGDEIENDDDDDLREGVPCSGRDQWL